jgi:hypothetical protein
LNKNKFSPFPFQTSNVMMPCSQDGQVRHIRVINEGNGFSLTHSLFKNNNKKLTAKPTRRARRLPR